MENKYFLHQIKVGKTNTTKGIVIHDTFDVAVGVNRTKGATETWLMV